MKEAEHQNWVTGGFPIPQFCWNTFWNTSNCNYLLFLNNGIGAYIQQSINHKVLCLVDLCTWSELEDHSERAWMRFFKAV